MKLVRRGRPRHSSPTARMEARWSVTISSLLSRRTGTPRVRGRRSGGFTVNHRQDRRAGLRFRWSRGRGTLETGARLHEHFAHPAVPARWPCAVDLDLVLRLRGELAALHQVVAVGRVALSETLSSRKSAPKTKSLLPGSSGDRAAGGNRPDHRPRRTLGRVQRRQSQGVLVGAPLTSRPTLVTRGHGHPQLAAAAVLQPDDTRDGFRAPLAALQHHSAPVARCAVAPASRAWD